LLEDEALRKILKAGGIAAHPYTLAPLLSWAHALYLENKTRSLSLSTKELDKRLSVIAEALLLLADNLDITSPSGPALNVMFGLCGIDTEKTTAWLYRVEQAVSEMRSVIGRDAKDIGLMTIWGVPLEVFAVKPAKEGKKEEPKTSLFVDLRQVFIKLGGTKAIGRGSKVGLLFKFVKACVEQIDDQIEMPKPASFRTLMRAAVERRRTSPPAFDMELNFSGVRMLTPRRSIFF
jgi:hypothetical protein